MPSHLAKLKGENEMSTTYIAVIVNLLAQFLPKWGIALGTADLTTTVQTLLTLGTGVWILWRRYNHGGVGILGGRTE